MYSLFVLDRPAGLTAELRTDAASTGNIVPQGAIETGAGGSRTPISVPVVVGILAVLVLWRVWRVRRTAR